MANPFRAIADFVKRSYYTITKMTLFTGYPAPLYSTDNLNSYDTCWLVNTCIDKIAEAVAGIKIKLYKVSKNEDVHEVKDHSLLDLLARPNVETSGFELLEATTSFLKLLGSSYLLKLRGERTKKVQALEVLRPDWVRVFFDGEEKKYEYRIGGEIRIFDAEDIIPIKQFNPKNHVYGLATVEPLMELIKTIIFTQRWNMNFFYNSAIPGGIIASKTKLKQDEKDELKKLWQREYGGWENAHRTAYVEGDLEYKTIQSTAKDMQFAELDERNVQKILAAFGVPKAIIGMQGMNRAEAEAQIYTFMKYAVLPDIQRIFDKLNEFLVPEFGDNLYLDYGDPVPEDRTAVIEEYKASLGGGGSLPWKSINEVRDLEGDPPIDGGWSLFIPFTLMPLEGTTESEKGIPKVFCKEIKLDSKKYYQSKKLKEQTILKERILPKLIKRKEVRLKNELKDLIIKYVNKRRELLFTPEQKKKMWIEHDKSLMSDTKIFRVMVRRLFKKQKERVKEAIESAYTGKSIIKATIDIPIDWNLEETIFAEVSMPVFSEIAVSRARKVSELLGEEFSLTERMKKFIEKKTSLFAKKVNGTTWDMVKDQLKEGVDKGESIGELSDRIDGVFGERLGYGSERIARTEVISASNEATLEAYQQATVVEKKEWLATMDDRVRDSHAEMNGEVANKDEEFSNGLMYPGDPSGDPDEIIDCRCTLLPVLET